MKERLIPYDVFNQWKLDRNIAVKTYVNSHVVSEYKHNLFSKIIPLLNKIGLITKAQHKNYVMIGAEKYIDIQLEFWIVGDRSYTTQYVYMYIQSMQQIHTQYVFKLNTR